MKCSAHCYYLTRARPEQILERRSSVTAAAAAAGGFVQISELFAMHSIPIGKPSQITVDCKSVHFIKEESVLLVSFCRGHRDKTKTFRHQY